MSKNAQEMTAADQIWNDIKSVEINMFSLPSKTVADYSKPMPIEPTKLYLTYVVSSFLPALEEAIGKRFNVEKVDKYLIVTRKS